MMRKPISDSDSPTVAEVYKLNLEEKAAVEEARAQFARGEVLTAEEAEQEIQTLLEFRQNPDELSDMLK
jgi:predicted transcriptional regulator